MMKPTTRAFFVVVLVAALASCDDGPGGPIVCTDEARPGIILRVFASGTLEPVTADECHVITRDFDVALLPSQ